jgi:hypothetical protein
MPCLISWLLVLSCCLVSPDLFISIQQLKPFSRKIQRWGSKKEISASNYEDSKKLAELIQRAISNQYDSEELQGGVIGLRRIIFLGLARVTVY